MGRKNFIQQCFEAISNFFSKLFDNEPMSSQEKTFIFLLIAAFMAAIAIFAFFVMKKRKKQRD
jgi:LPXTG-motif cell wall-anchored protein